MTGLAELFDAAASVEAPLCRLEAEEIFRAGRRRRRRRQLSAVSALLVIVLVATAGYGFRGLLVGVTPAEGRFVTSGLMWAGAGDARNFYVLRQVCPVTVEAGPECPPELLVSLDGGDSWTVRGTAPDSTSLRTLGAEVLIVSVPALRGDGSFARVTAPEEWEKITYDGGRTWGATVVSSDPIAAAPTGVAPFSWGSFGAHPDALYVPDPATRTVRPLATVPQLAAGVFNWWNPTSGGFWYTGLDPDTGIPTIAVSHDLGRSWHAAALPAPVATLTAKRMIDLRVASFDGRIAYAIYRLPDGSSSVYRTGDGGITWVAVDPDGAIQDDPGFALVTPQGEHVVANQVLDGTVTPNPTYVASPDGQAYTRVTLSGLPPNANPWMVDGGGYFAFNSDGVYLSADAFSWRQAYVP